MPKGCGSCTLCCTLMRVEMAPLPEPDKPDGVKCSHLCKRGCGIYEQRPDSCRSFECLWLHSQKQADPGFHMPKHLRPDKTGVVLEVNTAQNIVAHCSKPDDWKRGAMGGFLRDTAARARCSVIIDHGGHDASVLEPSGQLSKLRFIGTDPTSNERKYIRANLGQTSTAVKEGAAQ